MKNITLVNIGINLHAHSKQGFAEFKHEHHTLERQSYPADKLRVAHISRSEIRMWLEQGHGGTSGIISSNNRTSLSRVNLWRPRDTARAAQQQRAVDVLRQNYMHLQQISPTAHEPPWRTAVLRCAPSNWWNESRCIVATGTDWTTCEIVYTG
eukprot:2456731-Prymnesium_polylepis.1